MSRLLKIARREYIAYVRTIGFWLSMLLMPIGLAVAGGAPMLLEKSAPTPTLTIIDLGGEGIGEAIAPHLAKVQVGKPPAILVASPVAMTRPAEAGAALKPYLTGEKTLPDGRKLDAAAVISGKGEATAVDFWSAGLDPSLAQAVGLAVTEAMRGLKLKAAGMAPADIAALDKLEPKFREWSPKAAKGRVSLRDRLPGIVGFVLGMLLWSVIFTGAGILLNSVIEEKSSRILEVLLSSASAPEIMFGKILGAAGVTGTVLAVWAALGGTALAAANPEITRDVLAVLMSHGLIFYFAVYLIGGYLMYASLFIAVGAFCETTREAQTLLGPIMIILTIPLVFMGEAIKRPDAPLLHTLSWIPPFTPFVMATRAASQPPLWEVVGTGILMVAMIALVIWIAGRAFRAGALSTGRVNLAGFIARVRRPE
ncbi:MAG: ABC transporter permease [Ignavibacteriales bacterium]